MADVISAKTARLLASTIKGEVRRQRRGGGMATVVRTDQDGTTWVRVAGSDKETPVNGLKTADVKAGDVIQYQIDDTRLSITGNASDPAVGKSKASEIASTIVRPIEVAQRTAVAATDVARRIADAAKLVADAVNQHFWTDTHGIHVTAVTQDEWETSESGANVLLNSNGQLFRDGETNLLTLTVENGARALAIWDGIGNAASNIIASFGAIVQIGKIAAGHIVLSSHMSTSESDYDLSAMDLYGADGSNLDVHVYSRGAILDDSHEDRDYDVPGAGIDFGGGNKAGGSSIYTLFDNLANILNIKSGSDSVTKGSTIQLVAQRRWTSDASKTDTAAFVSRVDRSGNPPSSSLFAESGAKRADITLTASSAYTKAEIDAEQLLLSGTGVYPTYGSVGQTNTVPAGGYKNVTNISFGHTYQSAPTVIVGLLSSSTSSAIGQCSVAVVSVSTTSFTARLFNASSTDRSPGFYWIAIG